MTARLRRAPGRDAVGRLHLGRGGAGRRLGPALAVVVGLAADRALGEPPAGPHPVALFGRGMLLLERADYDDARRAGVVHAAVGVGAAALAGRRLAGGRRASRGRRLLAVAAATYVTVAGRALADAGSAVAAALDAGDLPCARRLLPALAGRDPSGLDAAELSRAVVESLAENTVDAVVAPALWALVAGAPGALAYRALNTLDAMVGHRSARYERFGWASARADDVANWIPARLAALLVAAVRPARAGQVWRAVRRDAGAHPSPNAGVVEAAFAAALGVRLGGRNRYGERVEERGPLGDGRPPSPADIPRAAALGRDVTVALGAAAVAVAAAGVAGRQRRGGPR